MTHLPIGTRLPGIIVQIAPQEPSPGAEPSREPSQLDLELIWFLDALELAERGDIEARTTLVDREAAHRAILDRLEPGRAYDLKWRRDIILHAMESQVSR